MVIISKVFEVVFTSQETWNWWPSVCFKVVFSNKLVSAIIKCKTLVNAKTTEAILLLNICYSYPKVSFFIM